MGYRGYTSRYLQDKLAARDGWRCKYCGVELVSGVDWNRCQYLINNDEIETAMKCGTPSEINGLLAIQRGAKSATIDHVIPVSRGGSPKDMNNMVLACHTCNSKKGTK